ncbi:hypothetical protein [Streptomyces sp. NPDC004629]|uniref:MmyB family transcriptional regulator n=1 Tax=Streptomyces sp. NPDC004629 TaxID=3364705 RepID=UPI0036C521C0
MTAFTARQSDLELAYETLRAADDPGQALITYAAEPDSASHDALRMLLTWATETRSPIRRHVGCPSAARRGCRRVAPAPTG